MLRKSVLAILFSLALSSSLVSAQTNVFQTVKDVIGSTIDAGLAIFSPLFEVIIGDYSTSEFFLAKVLLLLLLFVVINAALRQSKVFKKSPSVNKIVALIISILGIRFISDNQLIRGILLPYGTAGVAVTVIAPFVAFFYLIYTTKLGGFGRRAAWTAFGIVFAVFWASRTGGGLPSEFNWIFGLITTAIILALIFDRGIKGYFKSHEMSSFKRGLNTKTIAKLQAEYLNILHVDTHDAENRRDDIEHKLRSLGSNIP
jgi:hypothetical protein